VWADGKVFKGSYEKDLKEGEGVLEWPDGKKFIGNWSKSVQ